MATDCIIMRRSSRQTITYYIWNRYERATITTYYWNRYKVSTSYRYYWNRYNVVENTIYNWNEYSTTRYYEIVPITSTVVDNNHDVNTTETYLLYEEYEANSTVGIKFSGAVRPKLTSLEGNEEYVGYYRLYGLRRNGNLHNVVGSLVEVRRVYSENVKDWVLNVYMQSICGYDTTKYPEYSKGEYLTSVKSTDSSAYPNDGRSGSYWYVYTGTSTEYSKGSTSYGQVSSTSSSAYPNNGRSGSYWYVYNRQETVYSQGSANGSVSSTNRSQYPDNGRSGSYWYVYSNSSTSYSQGSYIDQVTSTNRNQYPDNNYSGNYWYVYQGTSQDTIASQASLNSILSE